MGNRTKGPGTAIPGRTDSKTRQLRRRHVGRKWNVNSGLDEKRSKTNEMLTAMGYTPMETNPTVEQPGVGVYQKANMTYKDKDALDAALQAGENHNSRLSATVETDSECGTKYVGSINKSNHSRSYSKRNVGLTVTHYLVQ